MPRADDDRLNVDYGVLAYDSNNITIRVSGAPRNAWLYYADCWHPFWRATVNGRNATIQKSNLAYKAVGLDEGENLVHFEFRALLFG